MKAALPCGLGVVFLLAACTGQPTTVHGVDLQAIERNCLQSTGSRIRRDSNECLPLAGRSYGRSELDRRGSRGAAEALAAMDPSISLGR
jgi:hypothetical protein